MTQVLLQARKNLRFHDGIFVHYVDIRSNLNRRIILKNENHFYFDILDNCCLCKKIKQSLKQSFQKPFEE